MTKCRICDALVPSHTELCPACGAPVPTSDFTPSADLEQELLQLLNEGQKVEAVVRYRDATGLPLGDAKKAVERLRQRGAAPTNLDAQLQEELLGLIGTGKKIQAIKLYREHADCGLAEAKEAVEALAAQHGVVSQGGGCATVLAVLLAVAAGATGIVLGVAALG